MSLFSPEFVASFDDGLATAFATHSGSAVPGRHGLAWAGNLTVAFRQHLGYATQFSRSGPGITTVDWSSNPVPGLFATGRFELQNGDGRAVLIASSTNGGSYSVIQGFAFIPGIWYFIELNMAAGGSVSIVDASHYLIDISVTLDLTVNGSFIGSASYTSSFIYGGVPGFTGTFLASDLDFERIFIDDVYLDGATQFGDGQALSNAGYSAPVNSWLVDDTAAPQDTSAFYEVGVADPVSAPWDTSGFFEVAVADPNTTPWDTSAFYEVAIGNQAGPYIASRNAAWILALLLLGTALGFKPFLDLIK